MCQACTRKCRSKTELTYEFSCGRGLYMHNIKNFEIVKPYLLEDFETRVTGFSEYKFSETTNSYIEILRLSCSVN